MKGRKPIPVYKWGADGNLVETYNSTTEAVKKNGIMFVDIHYSATHNTMARGHYYTRAPVCPRLTGERNPKHLRLKYAKGEQPEPTRMPWEGEDELFNIDGWADLFK